MPDLGALIGSTQHRAATVAPQTADRSTRTVEVVFATPTVVRRHSFFGGDFDDELVISREAIDMSRLNGGANVLDSHRSGTVGNVLGVVERGWIAGREARAKIRFSERDGIADIWADVESGILRNVSVGYDIGSFEQAPVREQRDKNVPLLRITAWTPLEISLVPVPADPRAQTRNHPMDPENTATAPGADIRANPDPVIADPAGGGGAAATMAELLGLLRDADTLSVPHGAVHAMLQRGLEPQEIRTAMLNEAARRDEAGAIISRHISGGVDHTAPDAITARMVDALVARCTGATPPESSREFMRRGMLDMAEDLLQANGVRTRTMSRDQILDAAMQRAGGMHTTSDFVHLLTASGNRVLLDAYAAAETVLKRVARRSDAPDFRTKMRLRLSNAPTLEEVSEHGEVTSGTMSESIESYGTATYARIFSLTRQSIVNDDLNAFSDPLLKMGRMAAAKEGDLLAALLNANSGAGADLEDTEPLYHSSRSNIIESPGDVIDPDSLGEAWTLLRGQKDLDDVTPIDVVPRFIVCGPAVEVAAMKAVAQITPAQSSAVNVFSGRLEVASDARLLGVAWRLFADPAVAPVIEWGYLSDAPGPQFMTREGFRIMGVEWRVALDFGAGLIGWRGTVMNSGDPST